MHLRNFFSAHSVSRQNTFRLIIGLLASFSFSLCSFAEERLPIEYFTDRDKYGSVQLSPGGDYLSVVVRVGDERQVVILDAKTLKPVKGGRHRFMRENYSVSGHTWVSDERLVFSAERFIPQLQERPLRNVMLYAVDYDGKRENVLASPWCQPGCDEWGADLLDPLIDDKKRALVLSLTTSGTRQKVGMINLRNGNLTKTTSIPPDTSSIVLDKEKRPRYAIASNTNGNRLVYYREEDSVDWELIGDYEYPGGWLYPYGFSEDGTKVFVLDSRDGGTEALGLSDLRLRNIDELYRDPITDIRSFMADKNDEVYGYVVGIGKPELKILNSKHERAILLSRLQGSFPGNVIRIADSSRDGNLHLVFVYSDRNPGEYYLFDKKQDQLSYVLSRRPWVKAESGAVIESFVFTARDGLKVPALLTMPNNESIEEKVPLLVHPHGGPHGPFDRWGYDPLVQFLADAGYAILQVNFRGSGGHGADFEAAGFRQWGRKIQHDIIDGTKYALENFPLNGDKVGIVGASFGGYSALQASVLEPDLFKASAGLVGVYDFELMYSAGDIRGRRYGIKYLEKALGRDEDEFREFSPLARAEELKGPVLLIQGEKDKRAPVVHSDKLAERLEELGHEFKYIVLPNEGHDLGFKKENAINTYQSIVGWFDTHL